MGLWPMGDGLGCGYLRLMKPSLLVCLLAMVLGGCQDKQTGLEHCGPNVACPSATSSTTVPSGVATTFRGIKAGHLRWVDIATGTSTDLGPATAFSGTWVAQSTGTCRSRVTGDAGAFEVNGAVNAMAISPNGKTLAYARGQARPDPDRAQYPCGEESLVLRDVASGSERVWTGDEGHVESLSWRLDSKALALQTAVCCTADITIKSFFVSRPGRQGLGPSRRISDEFEQPDARPLPRSRLERRHPDGAAREGGCDVAGCLGWDRDRAGHAAGPGRVARPAG
jgi:hypothetical protein